MSCRCWECGRFTSHWRNDESFCSREECWTTYEGPAAPGVMSALYHGPLHILPPRAIFCSKCADAIKYDVIDGLQAWM